MHQPLLALDVWSLVILAALLTWSLALPRLLVRTAQLSAPARSRRLLGYALAPWLISWMAVLLAYLPTWMAAQGWVSDWCLSRHGGLIAACPMHGSVNGLEPVAPMLALLTLVLVAVALLRLGWIFHGALKMAQRLRLLRTRSAMIAGVEVDFVSTNRALALSLCVPRRRIIVSEQVSNRLSPEELRALVEHERAHLDRHDVCVSALIAVSTMFLLPAARRQLWAAWHLAVEQCCDRLAAERTDPLTVASALVKFARAAGPAPQTYPLAAGFGAADLQARVAALLRPMQDTLARPFLLRRWLLVCVPLAFMLHELGEFALLPLVR